MAPASKTRHTKNEVTSEDLFLYCAGYGANCNQSMESNAKYILKWLLVFLLSIPFNSYSQFQSSSERIVGWSSDIDSLLVYIQRYHYVYSKESLPKKLIAKAKKLRNSMLNYSDERMLIEMEKLMYYLRDGHSYVLPFFARKATTFLLPLHFYLFEDGVFIIDAAEQYQNLIGSKVISFNGISVKKLINDMHCYVHQDNSNTVKWFAPTLLRIRGVHELYDLPSGAKHISLKLKDRNNQKIEKHIEFVPALDFKGIPKLKPSQLNNAPPLPLYQSDIETYFWFKKFTDQKIIYFQFNQVRDMKNESLLHFSKILDSTLHSDKPQKLIVDVRHNNGGNKDLLPPLIEVITTWCKRNPTFNLIVITSRNTFSAAQVFISLLDRETKVEFAGEPSSSKPNFVGEENIIKLSWSGAIVSISNRYHENIPGDKRNWIWPKYYIPLYSKQYFNNEDPVLEFLINCNSQDLN